MLVEFSGTIGLFGFAGLNNDLSDLLGIKVDLVMKGALRRRIGKRSSSSMALTTTRSSRMTGPTLP